MKKCILTSLLAIIILGLVISPSVAKKYSAAPSGQGLSTIGTSGDYTTLYDAFVDYNSTLNTGNWTIQILNDLVEPASIPIGNTANTITSSTILLTPGPGVNATIILNSTLDNTGPSGNLVFGSNSLTAYVDCTVANFIIDGSNNGTNSRNLTIQNNPAFTGFSYMIRVIGACPNFTIKNCNVYNLATAVSGYRAIQFETRKVGSNVFTPNGIKVINNYIVCTSNNGNAIGINVTTSGSGYVLGDLVPANVVFSNNNILAGNRGINFYPVYSATVSGNTCQVILRNSGLVPLGIFHFSNNGNYGGTINVFNNTIKKLETANITVGGYGVAGIEMDAPNTNYNIYNNMIAGFNFSANTAPLTAMVYQAIACNASATSNYNIYNNSIDMPNIPNLGNESTGNCNAIAVTATVGTATIKNNIIRLGQSGGAIYNLSTTASYVIDNNNLYADNAAGAIVGIFSGTTCTNLTAWQSSASQDANSQSVDPFTTSPSSWISHTDLHFNPFVPTASAAPLTAGVPISFITTDIDSQLRSGSTPWKGCDELYTTPYVTPSTLFARPNDVVQFVVAGGIAPYTWALSTSALGNLDTTSGATVNFTAAFVNLSGTLTVTDSSVPAQSAIVQISVMPTSAPLAIENSIVPNTRNDLIQFDLFE